MSDTEVQILTHIEAETLRRAREVTIAVRSRLSDTIHQADSSYQGSRLGYVDHAIESAGDAIFEALNITTNHGHCPNAARSLDITLGRIPSIEAVTS